MPRLLHRIFFNFNDGPDPFLPYLETWKRELPDFEIKLWDKTNLPLDLNDYTRTLAAERNHAYLSDYFRCWLLEKYGGVYLDADIEILDGNQFRDIYDHAQVDPESDLFIGVESSTNGQLTAHSMGVKDGTCHPLLTFMMGLYETSFSGPLHHIIRNFNMPSLMKLYFIERNKNDGAAFSEDGTFRRLEDETVADRIRIYPQDVFSPLTNRSGHIVVTAFGRKTCICHHFAATWKTDAVGSKEVRLFRDALDGGLYQSAPGQARAIHNRWPDVSVKCERPMWNLKPAQIQAIERFLNFLVPYGSPLYRLIRRRA